MKKVIIPFLLTLILSCTFGFVSFSYAKAEDTAKPSENLQITATEDAVNGPVYSMSNLNPNGVTTEGVTWDGLQTQTWSGAGMGLCTKTTWYLQNTAVVLNLKEPVKAEYYEKFNFKVFAGFGANVRLYSSTVTEFTDDNYVKEYKTARYKETEVSLSVSDFVAEDGYVHNITVVLAQKLTSTKDGTAGADNAEQGQLFVGEFLFILKEASTPEIPEPPTSDLKIIATEDAENGPICSLSDVNPNNVMTKDVTWDSLQKQSWDGAGMGLCTKTSWYLQNTAVVVTFKTPLYAEYYDTLTFTFYSGIGAKIRFYSSTEKEFNEDNYLLEHKAKRYAKNEVTFNVKDLAEEDGFVYNITMVLAQKLTSTKDGTADAANAEQGQVFLGEFLFKRKTETSYLGEYVLTDCLNKSIEIEGNAAFINENIPVETNGKGAFNEDVAIQINGETTLKFVKEMNYDAMKYGNLKMRFFVPSGSAVSELTFTAENGTKEVREVKSGVWQDLTITSLEFLNNNGNIGNITVTPNAEGCVIFGGAETEDKLRQIAKNYMTADISEIISMPKEGISYTPNGNDYEPVFERIDSSANVMKFQMKVSNFLDFNVMFTVSANGEKTNGVWFWFDKEGINGLISETVAYPSDVKENEWFTVELGCIPYSVDFIQYGVYAYAKINGKTMFDGNVDFTVQPTGRWVCMYVHQTSNDTTVSVKPYGDDTYTQLDELELFTTSGELNLTIGDVDRIKYNQNYRLNGEEISEIYVVSGNSASVDDIGYISATTAGTTVFGIKVTNTLGEKVYTVTIESAKYYTVKIAGKSQKVKEGECIVVPEGLKPPQEGLVIAGWYKDKECTKKFDINKGVYEDMTLYVGWKKPNSSGCHGSIALTGVILTAMLSEVAFISLKRKEK